MIQKPIVHFLGRELTGAPVQKLVRTVKDLAGIFQDQTAFNEEVSDKVAYEVSSYFPVEEGREGGLFFGITYLYPGKIGREYYMTKGHLHTIRNRAEFYWCLEGKGMLLLMDEDRNTWAEEMYPGSLHYIDGFTAHRVANTSKSVLTFGACWPSDAGHDYESIAKNGFSKRLLEVDGKPALV